jgi:uncharacterized membrane protein
VISLEQCLILAAIAVIPMLAGSVITGSVLRFENAKRRRNARELQAVLDTSDAD